MLNVLLMILAIASHSQAAPAAKTPAARTVEIAGGDNMKYSPPRITAKPGETLRIVLTVTSKFPKKNMAHNVVILGKGVNAAKLNEAAMAARTTDFIPQDRKADIIAFTGLAGNGETVEVTFTVPSQRGNYEFICTFPGHYTLGMKGVLVVK